MQKEQTKEATENFNQLIKNIFEPITAIHQTRLEAFNEISKIHFETNTKIFSLYTSIIEKLFTSKKASELCAYNQKATEEVCDKSVKKVNEILHNLSQTSKTENPKSTNHTKETDVSDKKQAPSKS